MDKRSLIADLRVKRADERTAAGNLLEHAKRSKRGLTTSEETRFDAHESEIRALNDRIDELSAQVEADDAAADMAKRYAPAPSGNPTESRNSHMTTSARITSEPSTYSREGRNSYFLDLARVAQTGDRDARARLERNDAEQRALNTTNGSGGEFVPPAWVVDEYVRYARPHRTFADLVTTNPLPAGVDIVNIPKVSGGTATAVQSTQNTAVQNTDMTTTSIASSVFTVAGGQVISLQMLEQSPIRTDEVILSDLAADYAKQLDTLYLTGSGAAGQPTGILTLAGTNAVTWSGTALTGATSLYNAVASAISKIWSTRFAAPTAIVMHPRRFAWMLAQVDGTNRPIIVPAQGSAFNAPGLLGPSLNAEGPVGVFAGLPVFLDPNIPTNKGVGSDEDRIVVLKADDVFAWEGNVKAEAFPQTYANQLSLFLRLYNYSSFQAARYPSSISVISGTGLNLTV
ncbi:phage major capsid protein [Streptomyces mirabilis]|uniref:phage major capsid protein n=1 Tax=Streptomyces mirabilis TaxID=68239 RepID=UPI002255F56E|nr:phage major capsid protein [Streptomyces mirabilis]MCX4422514.1 phage major capsid protein [Streptomyces mirabilis]